MSQSQESGKDEETPGGGQTNNEFDFYFQFTKPLVLYLPTPEDRAIAAAWVQKLEAEPETEEEKRLRLDYLKLLLFVLQRGRLSGIFRKQPPSGPLQPFPQGFTISDMGNLMIDQDDVQACGGGDARSVPYTIEISNDLREFIAAQEVPNFGVQMYYAWSSDDPVHKWNLFDEEKFPQHVLDKIKLLKEIKSDEKAGTETKGVIPKKICDVPLVERYAKTKVKSPQEIEKAQGRSYQTYVGLMGRMGNGFKEMCEDDENKYCGQEQKNERGSPKRNDNQKKCPTGQNLYQDPADGQKGDELDNLLTALGGNTGNTGCVHGPGPTACNCPPEEAMGTFETLKSYESPPQRVNEWRPRKPKSDQIEGPSWALPALKDAEARKKVMARTRKASPCYPNPAARAMDLQQSYASTYPVQKRVQTPVNRDFLSSLNEQQLQQFRQKKVEECTQQCVEYVMQQTTQSAGQQSMPLAMQQSMQAAAQQRMLQSRQPRMQGAISKRIGQGGKCSNGRGVCTCPCPRDENEMTGPQNWTEANVLRKMREEGMVYGGGAGGGGAGGGGASLQPAANAPVKKPRKRWQAPTEPITIPIVYYEKDECNLEEDSPPPEDRNNGMKMGEGCVPKNVMEDENSGRSRQPSGSPKTPKQLSPCLSRQPSPIPQNQQTPCPPRQPSPIPQNQQSQCPPRQPSPIPQNQQSPCPPRQPSPIPQNQQSQCPPRQPSPIPQNQQSPCPPRQPSPIPQNQQSPCPPRQPSPIPQNEQTPRQLSPSPQNQYVCTPRPLSPVYAKAGFTTSTPIEPHGYWHRVDALDYRAVPTEEDTAYNCGFDCSESGVPPASYNLGVDPTLFRDLGGRPCDISFDDSTLKEPILMGSRSPQRRPIYRTKVQSNYGPNYVPRGTSSARLGNISTRLENIKQKTDTHREKCEAARKRLSSERMPCQRVPPRPPQQSRMSPQLGRSTSRTRQTPTPKTQPTSPKSPQPRSNPCPSPGIGNDSFLDPMYGRGTGKSPNFCTPQPRTANTPNVFESLQKAYRNNNVAQPTGVNLRNRFEDDTYYTEMRNDCAKEEEFISGPESVEDCQQDSSSAECLESDDTDFISNLYVPPPEHWQDSSGGTQDWRADECNQDNMISLEAVYGSTQGDIQCVGDNENKSQSNLNYYNEEPYYAAQAPNDECFEQDNQNYYESNQYYGNADGRIKN